MHDVGATRPAEPASPSTAAPALARLTSIVAGTVGAAVLGLLVGRLDAGMGPMFAAGAPWLMAGLSLSILLRLGIACWPGVLIGTLAAALSLGQGWAGAVALASAHALAVVLAAFALRRLHFGSDLDRASDVGWLVLVCTAVAGPVLAIGQGLAWWAHGGGTIATARLLTALPWHALGLLIGAVPALSLTRVAATTPVPPVRRWMAGAVALAFVAVSGVIFLWTTLPEALVAALGWWPHALLILLVLLAGLTAASSGLLVVAVIGALATALGVGPHHHLPPSAAAFALVNQLGSMVLSMLLVHGMHLLVARREQRACSAVLASGLALAEWHLLRSAEQFRSDTWIDMSQQSAEAAWSPQDWLADTHPEERERLRLGLEQVTSGAHPAMRLEMRVRGQHGWRWVDTHVMAMQHDRAGQPLRLLATMTDVSERHEAQARQRLSASLFEHLHEGLLIADADLRVLDANPAYSEILGVPLAELMGTVPSVLRPQPSDPLARQQRDAMWAGLRADGQWRGELIECRRSGEICTLQATISQVHGPEGDLRYHVLAIADITEQRMQRERLERQAHFDELTRLPNRARLTQLLVDAMRAADRDGYLLVVCYLDLDRFKPVNERFGHEGGDRLLVELAGRLRGTLRSRDLWADAAARLGGDEFVLLLRAGTLDEARLAVERVLRVVAQPYAVDPNQDAVQMSASVGATVYPIDRSDADTLLRHADHAMYGAKQSGRNGYLFFDPELRRRTEERVMAIGRVQEALDRDEFVLYYQPIVDMRLGKLLGFEALLRWQHPQQGMIAPLQFLPLIEHTGLSARIGDWVMGQALEHLAHWRRDGLDITVNVNVSARHLQEPDFVQRLSELLARHPDPLAEYLKLEIVESAAHADLEATSALLARCRALGVRAALDDFGTGYSTLTHLQRLPVDVLKIDRSFVNHMLDDSQDRALVVGVIGLAKTFSCTVVAEGVESAAQARLLMELGCDLGQGTGIGSPMPATEVARWSRSYTGMFSLAPASRASADRP